jgi:hypothetical protein
VTPNRLLLIAAKQIKQKLDFNDVSDRRQCGLIVTRANQLECRARRVEQPYSQPEKGEFTRVPVSCMPDNYGQQAEGSVEQLNMIL